MGCMGDFGCGVGDFMGCVGDFAALMGDSDYCMGVFRFNGRLYLLTEKYA